MSEKNFETTLLKIAQNAILSELSGSEELNLKELVQSYPQLNEKKATFVTLNLNGNLRGCIGSLIATRPLIEDITHNAKAAAFGDPRFAPLSLTEFEDVDIELSILSTPERLSYDDVEDLKSKIKIGTHGVVLKYGNHQATFLPQVWEQLNSFELFFEHLCLKAGLNRSCLNSKPEIYTYQVRKIK